MFIFSKLDSDRFKLNVHRGVAEQFDFELLKLYVKENNPDLFIVRYAAETIEKHHLLEKIGYKILFTDALVYYDINLTNLVPKTLRNNLIFKEVDINSLHLFKSLIPIIFKDYRNHYFSNPYLDKSEILEGYVEWASAYVTAIDTSKKSWLVYKDDILIGFATCSMNNIDNSCEGVLYGVHPEYSGGGIYTDIIRFTQAYFKKHNFEKMYVSTQIQNYAVQKVWQKENFLINKAYYTYHLIKQ